MKRDSKWNLTPREMEIINAWVKNEFSTVDTMAELKLSKGRIEAVIYEPRAKEYIDTIKKGKSDVRTNADITKRFMSQEWILGEVIKLYDSIPDMGDIVQIIREDCKKMIEESEGLSLEETSPKIDLLIKNIENNIKIFKDLSDRKSTSLNMIAKFHKEFGETLNEETMRIMTMPQKEIMDEAERLVKEIRELNSVGWLKNA